jgi:hypothetical protein
MNNTDRARRVREVVRGLERLQPDCARRLLRQRQLQDALRQTEEQAEGILEPDSPAFRLFDRMRKERSSWWRVHGEYVDPEDCKHLDSWVEILATVVKELDPDIGAPEELNADLIREVEALKSLMVAVATGGPRIEYVNAEYQERHQRVSEGLAKRRLHDPNPYDDLWQWYGKWSSGDLPTYRSRREYLAGLFGPLLTALRQAPTPVPTRAFSEPTGWAKIDRNLGLARSRLEQASNELDFQQVGHACRETLIDLAQEVFDRELHQTEDGVEPSDTDARRMLDAYLSHELLGGANEAPRRHAKASLALANELTHKRTATFRDAALCAEATASVVNIVAIISGKRDPKNKGDV